VSHSGDGACTGVNYGDGGAYHGQDWRRHDHNARAAIFREFTASLVISLYLLFFAFSYSSDIVTLVLPFLALLVLIHHTLSHLSLSRTHSSMSQMMQMGERMQSAEVAELLGEADKRRTGVVDARGLANLLVTGV